MKKRLLTLFTAIVLVISTLSACGGTNNTDDSTTADTSTNTESDTSSETETHVHTYTEAITTAPTCETEGLKTFTCECGDSYTEVMTATGHNFETYTYNNDATYSADGTETAKCSNCEATDTKTVDGSMLTRTETETTTETPQSPPSSTQSPSNEDALVDEYGYYNANWIEQQWWFANLNQVVDDGNGKAYMYGSTNGAYWSTKGEPILPGDYTQILMDKGATNITLSGYEAVDALSATANKERGIMFDINYLEWTYTPAQ